MNHNAEFSDNDVLCAVRDSLSGMTMPTAPRLELIVARGRARRRRRAGLSAATGRNGPARLAAFSVVSNPDGTTTLTLGLPGGLLDPSAVRQALAQHGIPALVTVGKYCTTAVTPLSDGAITMQPALTPSRLAALGRTHHGPPQESIVFNPSAMPAGSQVSIGYRQEGQNYETSVTLIEADAPLTCQAMPDPSGSGGPGTSNHSIHVSTGR